MNLSLPFRTLLRETLTPAQLRQCTGHRVSPREGKHQAPWGLRNVWPAQCLISSFYLGPSVPVASPLPLSWKGQAPASACFCHCGDHKVRIPREFERLFFFFLSKNTPSGREDSRVSLKGTEKQYYRLKEKDG